MSDVSSGCVMVRINSLVAAQDCLATGVGWRETKISTHTRGVGDTSVLQEALEMVRCRNVEPGHSTQRRVEHPTGERLWDTSPETQHPR